MAKAEIYLPDECWELIFKHLPSHNLAEVSVVCKRFLSITNHLLLSLTIWEPSIPLLPRIFRRFSNIKSIDLYHVFDICHPDDILSQLSNSQLVIQLLDVSQNVKGFPRSSLLLCPTVRNLRVFRCNGTYHISNQELMAVADACPLLEELDINYVFINSPRMDIEGGIVYVSVRLKHLRAVRMIDQKVTDKCLHALVSNCALLREIEFTYTEFMTSYGVSLVIRNCAIVTAMRLDAIDFNVVKESFVRARGLCELDLSRSTLSDELFYLIAQTQFSLRKLRLERVTGVTAAGIIALLSKSQSLQHLDLQGISFLTDQDIIAFTNFLGQLYSINLFYCSKLTSISFFALIQRCPLLNKIEFDIENIKEVDDAMGSTMSSQIKILNLGWRTGISTKCLMKVLSVCPKLEELDIRGHYETTKDGGTIDILRICPELKHLKMDYSNIRVSFDTDFEVSKLESLQASRSRLCDKTLTTIANKCKGLLELDLSQCLDVTGKGVRKIIENCRSLKELNLTDCNMMIDDVSSWTVISRPSLRIFLPTELHPTEDQWNHFSFLRCPELDFDLY